MPRFHVIFSSCPRCQKARTACDLPQRGGRPPCTRCRNMGRECIAPDNSRCASSPALQCPLSVQHALILPTHITVPRLASSTPSVSPTASSRRRGGMVFSRGCLPRRFSSVPSLLPGVPPPLPSLPSFSLFPSSPFTPSLDGHSRLLFFLPLFRSSPLRPSSRPLLFPFVVFPQHY